MTCFTSLSDVNRYSRIDVSDARTRRPVDVADHGSETDPKVRIEVSELRVTDALVTVSRVSKLPTWTRDQAVRSLAAGSWSGTCQRS